MDRPSLIIDLLRIDAHAIRVDDVKKGSLMILSLDCSRLGLSFTCININTVIHSVYSVSLLSLSELIVVYNSNIHSTYIRT
jgi:hypothetical protein